MDVRIFPEYRSTSSPDSRPRTRILGDSNSLWNDVGFRIALVGGIFPLLLGAVVIVVAFGLLQFAGPSLERSAYAVLLELTSLLAAGFPYLLFGCFLISTLVAVPLVSIFAKTRERANVPTRRDIFVGVALIIGMWTSLFYLFVTLLPH